MPYPTWFRKSIDKTTRPSSLLTHHLHFAPILELIPQEAKKGSSRCISGLTSPVDLAFSSVNKRAQNTSQNKDIQSACEHSTDKGREQELVDSRVFFSSRPPIRVSLIESTRRLLYSSPPQRIPAGCREPRRSHLQATRHSLNPHQYLRPSLHCPPWISHTGRPVNLGQATLSRLLPVSKATTTSPKSEKINIVWLPCSRLIQR